MARVCRPAEQSAVGQNPPGYHSRQQYPSQQPALGSASSCWRARPRGHDWPRGGSGPAAPTRVSHGAACRYGGVHGMRQATAGTGLSSQPGPAATGVASRPGRRRQNRNARFTTAPANRGPGPAGPDGGISTRRHNAGTCARITCARKMGPHEPLDDTDGNPGAACQARAGEAERLCAATAEGAAGNRCRGQWHAHVRSASGDPGCLVLGACGRGGDAQGILGRKSGSPRSAANLRGHSLRIRCGIGSYGMTVTDHVGVCYSRAHVLSAAAAPLFPFPGTFQTRAPRGRRGAYPRKGALPPLSGIRRNDPAEVTSHHGRIVAALTESAAGRYSCSTAFGAGPTPRPRLRGPAADLSRPACSRVLPVQTDDFPAGPARLGDPINEPVGEEAVARS